MMKITRREEFSAAHRLFNPGYSDEKNEALYGPCANPNYHGHNYVVEVTLRGPVDPDTGMTFNLADLKETMRREVIDKVDHKNLNLECREFASLNPSVENMARVIWNRLDGAFGAARLASIRVWETPKTYAEYSGSG
ncbi:MAG: 6-carboxytetrahydropterin synthase [Proteobacteria bacterium]|nr:6-carboxytetrahydropterin synthase [Pseudomonadota bacterium]